VNTDETSPKKGERVSEEDIRQTTSLDSKDERMKKDDSKITQ